MTVGNAFAAGAPYRSWIVGHFVEGPLHSDEVEVKWARHAAGDARQEWSADEATTLCILVRGRFRILFPDGEALLAAEGDFAHWPPGLSHRWVADAESVVVTVRWPSSKRG
ncbi:MAG: signal peptidase I [Chloroflexota bacterium]|nr:signal peptidase I [Chloroflexota bacterium]